MQENTLEDKKKRALREVNKKLVEVIADKAIGQEIKMKEALKLHNEFREIFINFTQQWLKEIRDILGVDLAPENWAESFRQEISLDVSQAPSGYLNIRHNHDIRQINRRITDFFSKKMENTEPPLTKDDLNVSSQIFLTDLKPRITSTTNDKINKKMDIFFPSNLLKAINQDINDKINKGNNNKKSGSLITEIETRLENWGNEGISFSSDEEKEKFNNFRLGIKNYVSEKILKSLFKYYKASEELANLEASGGSYQVIYENLVRFQRKVKSEFNEEQEKRFFGLIDNDEHFSTFKSKIGEIKLRAFNYLQKGEVLEDFDFDLKKEASQRLVQAAGYTELWKSIQSQRERKKYFVWLIMDKVIRWFFAAKGTEIGIPGAGWESQLYQSTKDFDWGELPSEKDFNLQNILNNLLQKSVLKFLSQHGYANESSLVREKSEEIYRQISQYFSEKPSEEVKNWIQTEVNQLVTQIWRIYYLESKLHEEVVWEFFSPGDAFDSLIMETRRITEDKALLDGKLIDACFFPAAFKKRKSALISLASVAIIGERNTWEAKKKALRADIERRLATGREWGFNEIEAVFNQGGVAAEKDWRGLDGNNWEEYWDTINHEGNKEPFVTGDSKLHSGYEFAKNELLVSVSQVIVDWLIEKKKITELKAYLEAHDTPAEKDKIYKPRKAKIEALLGKKEEETVEFKFNYLEEYEAEGDNWHLRLRGEDNNYEGQVVNELIIPQIYFTENFLILNQKKHFEPGFELSTGLVFKEYIDYKDFVLTIKSRKESSFILRKAAVSAKDNSVLLEIIPSAELPQAVNYLLLDPEIVQKLKKQTGNYSLTSQTTHDGDKEVDPGIFSWYNWGRKFTINEALLEPATREDKKNLWVIDDSETLVVGSKKPVLKLGKKALTVRFTISREETAERNALAEFEKILESSSRCGLTDTEQIKEHVEKLRKYQGEEKDPLKKWVGEIWDLWLHAQDSRKPNFARTFRKLENWSKLNKKNKRDTAYFENWFFDSAGKRYSIWEEIEELLNQEGDYKERLHRASQELSFAGNKEAKLVGEFFNQIQAAMLLKGQEIIKVISDEEAREKPSVDEIVGVWKILAKLERTKEGYLLSVEDKEIIAQMTEIALNDSLDWLRDLVAEVSFDPKEGKKCLKDLKSLLNDKCISAEKYSATAEKAYLNWLVPVEGEIKNLIKQLEKKLNLKEDYRDETALLEKEEKDKEFDGVSKSPPVNLQVTSTEEQDKLAATGCWNSIPVQQQTQKHDYQEINTQNTIRENWSNFFQRHEITSTQQNFWMKSNLSPFDAELAWKEGWRAEDTNVKFNADGTLNYQTNIRGEKVITYNIDPTSINKYSLLKAHEILTDIANTNQQNCDVLTTGGAIDTLIKSLGNNENKLPIGRKIADLLRLADTKYQNLVSQHNPSSGNERLSWVRGNPVAILLGTFAWFFIWIKGFAGSAKKLVEPSKRENC